MKVRDDKVRTMIRLGWGEVRVGQAKAPGVVSTGVMLESELARTPGRASLSAQSKAGNEGLPTMR